MEPRAVIDNARDEVAAKNRFESFKLGKGLPFTVAQKRSHVRSHSRNASLSSSVSSPLPLSVSSKSTNATDMSTPLNPAPPSKRNSHHRRRSSVSTRIESAEMMGVSIPDLPPSTSEDNINFGEKDSIRRRALWALEGKPDVAFSKVEIPELSTPVMEKMMYDFATKTSQPQNVVPSYGPSINTLMASKRDSFKILGPSSSSKDQLHTLVEEEEEEDDAHAPATPATPITPALAITKATPARPRPANLNLRPLSLTPENLVSTVTGLATPSLTPSPRLGLKSLALVPSTCDDVTNFTNIRQSATPSPTLRRLSLSLNFAADSPTPASTSSEDNKGSRRSSISYKSSSSSSNGVAMNSAGLPTPEATPTSFDRRYSMSLSEALRRRSSGSSSASGDEDSFPNHPTQSRPLSASEQHFLFKSHNALLARITDLERALSVRRMSSGGLSTNESSRPVSVASDFSSSSEYGNGEPGDEMLRLVADLKAERDELKRDVDGWRTRVGDMEKQLGVVAGRVETERREAWLARSMSGLLEVEKKTLLQKLADVQKSVATLEEEKQALETETREAKVRVASLEEELERVKQELDEERKAKYEASTALNQEPMTPTPRTPEPRSRPLTLAMKRGRGFTSVDSESSMTDVEDTLDENSPKFNFPLKAVEEDDEDTFSEEDNGLAGYEDEEESDVSLRSSSSFDSEDDFPRSVSHIKADVPTSVAPNVDTSRAASPPAIHAPRPTHAPRASLSKTWTFPIGAQVLNQTVQQDLEVDRFFQCFQDDESDGSDSAPRSPFVYSYERSKGLFASGFQYGADDENSPFFFPLGAGVEVESPKSLDVVHEEEDDDVLTEVEDEENMFGEAGGIQITFTPPEDEEGESFDSQRSSSPSPAKPIIPIIKFFDADSEEEEEDSVPFNFGRPLVSEPAKGVKKETVFSAPQAAKPFNFGRPVVSEVKEVVASTPSVMITPPSSLPRPVEPLAHSPSSIPRATSFKPPFSLTDMTTSTPPKFALTRVVSASNNHSSNAYVTPPNKRGGTMPSFIPQPISSPSPMRNVSVAPKAKATSPDTTFVPQPQRKPLMLANNNAKSQNVSSGATHVDPVMNTRSPRRSSDIHAAPVSGAHSEMKSIDLSDPFSIRDNISTSVSTITHTQTYPYLVQSCNLPSSSYSSVAPPPETPSSSFSIMAPFSARVSLRTLTNFIPNPWSQRRDAPVPSYSNVRSTPKIDNVLAPKEPAQQTVPLKRAFVSKEKQLEKLRSRLEREGTMKMRTSVSVWCNKCDPVAVSL